VNLQALLSVGRGDHSRAVEFATLEWVDWFNNRRLLEPIGNIPPAEAEERYYAILEKPAMAA
jgi:putative transposase